MMQRPLACLQTDLGLRGPYLLGGAGPNFRTRASQLFILWKTLSPKPSGTFLSRPTSTSARALSRQRHTLNPFTFEPKYYRGLNKYQYYFGGSHYEYKTTYPKISPILTIEAPIITL